MKRFRIRLLFATAPLAALAASGALAGEPGTAMPGPGIVALLALGVVGAIGIARLRK